MSQNQVPEDPHAQRRPEPSNENREERKLDLILARSLESLSPAEQLELERLEGNEADRNFPYAWADRIVAELQLMWLAESAPEREEEGLGSMPATLYERIRNDGESLLDIPPGESVSGSTKERGGRAREWLAREWLAWSIAVAALFLLVMLLPWSKNSSSDKQLPPSLASLRQTMLEQKDSLRWDWTTTEDPAAKTASGDVVWNDRQGNGYMRFVGLPKNDPLKEQYQLWIFDEARPAETPVDGGLFDIGTDGEVIVPINARLAISKATMFAITIERPGGVVVSKRERLPLLAKSTDKPE